MLDYFGYVFFIIFIIFMLNMINKGPFIFERGVRHFINIKNIQFDVNQLKIKQGDTIVITNFDQFRHSIITDDLIIKNSGLLFEFDTFQHTFNREGVFTFTSSLYGKMDDLVITVEETLKGREFYNEIGTNLFNFVKEFFSTIWFYFTFTIKKVLRNNI